MQIKGLLLVAVYIILRFLLSTYIDSYLPFGSYGFEILFCVVVAFLLKEKPRLGKLKVKPLLIGTSIGLAAGFLIFKGAVYKNMFIPFDFKERALLVMLLVIGPLIEELVFRFALLKSFEATFKKPMAATILSSLLFSYGHFHAYFYVPEEMYSFIFYQTAYTLVLGLWLSAAFYYFKRSVIAALLLHMSFNLGFYLGSLS